VRSRRAGGGKFLDDVDRIVGVDGRLVVRALREPDAAPAEDVDRWYYDYR
jgi:hypothetical protein